ncbi:hypothetical protein ACIO3O_00320 [Streptomyces sp. NPDC087440]|uniref:hypothetical protein n=1 Tax=Streptomyces sp. NPDC087440 TaxID=3365790 RepID=UPI0038271717
MTSFSVFARARSGLTSEVFGVWGWTGIFSAERLRARSSATLSRLTRFTSPGSLLAPTAIDKASYRKLWGQPMRRTFTLFASALSVCGLAAGGWAGCTWWHGSPSPADSPALCAPDLSRPEYVSAASENIALITVTGKHGFVAEERATPGGVQTVTVRTDKILKGTPPGSFRLGQSVDTKPDGSYTIGEGTSRYDLLLPGHQYIVGFYLGGSYGDGYALYTEAAPNATAATTAWTQRIRSKAVPPEPAQC